jgi:hypothetical protein
MNKETTFAPLVIVISNFNKNNPYAEKRIPFTGTWSEAREVVLKIRAENPTWYVGVSMPY